MKLNRDHRRALARHLLTRYRAVTRAKGDAVEMALVAKAFDLAALFGAGVPSSAEFMVRYWTTVGPVVYHPGADAELEDHLRVFFHEMTHVVLFWRDPINYLRRYLTKKGRAEIEAECERAAIEGWYVLTGELPTTLDAVDVTRHGYALGDGPGEHDDHADLTRDLIEQAVTSVKGGVLSTDVGLEVRAWLWTNVPEAIAEGVL